LLVFTLLLGSWMLFRGIRRDQWIWVIAGFAAIGLAFNIKMLQAYMVVPAFYLFYLFASKLNWRTKSKVLAGATTVLIIVSISWAVIVDSIPKENRPYIGSSQTNSVLELAFGYNGIARLTGNHNGANGGGIGAGGSGGGKMPNQAQNTGRSPNLDRSRGQAGAANDNGARSMGTGNGGPGGMGADGRSPGGMGTVGGAPGGKGNGGGGMFHTGTAGPLRLFQSDLSGQISWLLPFAAFASIGLLAGIRRRKPLTSKHKETLFWLAWLLPAMAFFSVAGFFHQYYLIMLAPPIAALTGAGWVELYQLYRNKESWKSWLLPVGIFATAVFQIIILAVYTTQISLGWSIGLGIAGIGLLLTLVLWSKKEKINRSIALAAILVLLAAPLYWAATPLLYGGNSKLPEAGPQLKSSGQGMSAGQRDGGRPGSKPGEGTDTALLDYLTKNNTGEKYLFATTSVGAAESYIIDTGKAVMAMGGFSGGDPILTIDKLKTLIANKEVKYFMFSSGGFGADGSSDVTAWIKANSTIVPSSEWQTSAANGMQGSPKGMGGSSTLYKINS
jgi:4-amino-4-deoxy-L-arabinose transferase-like glycosyltransferase